jgi:predicted aspartyl protease
MPPRTAPVAEEIPLTRVGGVYALPVEINGVSTLKFILDSGASEVHMQADVVSTLLRTGTIQDTDFLPGQTYRLADRSTIKSPRFMLRHVKIGSRRIHDIPASVGSVRSALLLGQSVLEKLGTWGIDSQRQILIIGSIGRKLP